MKAFGKSMVLLALALLVFPIVALADNTNSYLTTWVNSGDRASAKSGFSLRSTIAATLIPNGAWITGNNPGPLQPMTGGLHTGTLKQGCLGTSACSFSFVGRSFTTTGADGGSSFGGKFGSNIFLPSDCIDGICPYSITGQGGGGVELTTLNGQPVGSTVLGSAKKAKFTGGSVTAINRAGLTNVGVPEFGTLGLLGVGLFGLAGILRRKLVRT
jgi:hypothetical protein